MEITKWQIISTVVTLLISTLLSTLLRRVFELYIPDKNTMSSYIKNFLYLSLRYLLPATLIIWAFIFDSIDKFFIFKISFFMCAIFFNLIIDLLKKQRDLFERVLTIVEKNSTDNEGLKDITSDHLKTTSKLADNVRILADNLAYLKNNKP
jgi:hypothetical protein